MGPRGLGTNPGPLFVKDPQPSPLLPVDQFKRNISHTDRATEGREGGLNTTDPAPALGENEY